MKKRRKKKQDATSEGSIKKVHPLRALRKRLELDQIPMAKMMGVAQATISRIELDQLDISMTDICALLAHVNFDLNDFARDLITYRES